MMIDQSTSKKPAPPTNTVPSTPGKSVLPHDSDNKAGLISGVVSQKQIGKYKVEVIRDKCIGAASCVAIAPAVFAMDEEDIAIILSQDGNDDETKLLAAQSCPTAAIIVTDTSTGKQVWPIE